MKNRIISTIAALLTITISLFLPVIVQAVPKTLVYSWSGNVGPLNPHLYSPNQMFAQSMVYESLVRYGSDGQVIPWLAESWEVSADGCDYLFHLRKGVFFSDGTPFDALAVKKNHDAVLANAKRHTWLGLIDKIKETKVIDTYTVKLVLTEPYYPLLYDMSLARPMRYLSPSALPKSGNSADDIKAPIGTGPWTLAESRLGEYDLFKRNDRYWGKKPAIDRILVKVIPDHNTRAMAFATGEVDLIYGEDQISLDTFDRFKNDPRYTTAISPPMATRALAINSKRGPTRELAVRQAIQHAVNKEAIVKGIFLNTEIKADTLFWPNKPYCDLDLPPYEYNPGKSEQILEQAGWQKTHGPFRTKDKKNLTVDLCFTGNNALEKTVAEVLQADLKNVGIQANLIGEEADSLSRRQKGGNFNLIFNGTWGSPYDPHAYCSSMRVPSHADYQAQSGLSMKEEIDRKIGLTLSSTDQEKRHLLYREILSTLHNQAVYLPISYTTEILVHGKKIHNVSFGPTLHEIPFATMSIQ